jgi:hypothetical protein
VAAIEAAHVVHDAAEVLRAAGGAEAAWEEGRREAVSGWRWCG